jgi:hypothetical protein
MEELDSRIDPAAGNVIRQFLPLFEKTTAICQWKIGCDAVLREERTKKVQRTASKG